MIEVQFTLLFLKKLYISCRESIIRKKTFLSFDSTSELNTKVKVRGMSFTLMIREELYYMITSLGL